MTKKQTKRVAKTILDMTRRLNELQDLRETLTTEAERQACTHDISHTYVLIQSLMSLCTIVKGDPQGALFCYTI